MKKGFTLIEVMVVAVIVAILAAVAIPAYNGYVTRAGNNVATNVAGTVAAGLGTLVAENLAHSATGNATGPGIATLGANVSVKIPEGVYIAWTATSVTASHSKGNATQSVQF